MEIDKLWATPIWRARLEEVNSEDIIQFIQNEQEKSPELVVKSNYGGWQSRTNLYDDTVMGELCGGIVDICNEFWSFIGGIQFQQMWAAINKRNDWNMIHQHGQYEISGGYYLRVPKDSGRIVFSDPTSLRANRFINKCIIGGDLQFYQPKEHDLMMWPSYINHLVEPSKSDEDRIMISFDLNISLKND